MDRPSGDRISIVATKHIVVTVRQIQAAEMAIAIDADIANLDRVRPHVPNQCRPHQKSVAIEFTAASIVVIKHAGLKRVALLDEILSKNVRDVNVLLPPI